MSNNKQFEIVGVAINTSTISFYLLRFTGDVSWHIISPHYTELVNLIPKARLTSNCLLDLPCKRIVTTEDILKRYKVYPNGSISRCTLKLRKLNTSNFTSVTDVIPETDVPTYNYEIYPNGLPIDSDSNLVNLLANSYSQKTRHFLKKRTPVLLPPKIMYNKTDEQLLFGCNVTKYIKRDIEHCVNGLINGHYKSLILLLFNYLFNSSEAKKLSIYLKHCVHVQNKQQYDDYRAIRSNYFLSKDFKRTNCIEEMLTDNKLYIPYAYYQFVKYMYALNNKALNRQSTYEKMLENRQIVDKNQWNYIQSQLQEYTNETILEQGITYLKNYYQKGIDAILWETDNAEITYFDGLASISHLNPDGNKDVIIKYLNGLLQDTELATNIYYQNNLLKVSECINWFLGNYKDFLRKKYCIHNVILRHNYTLPITPKMKNMYSEFHGILKYRILNFNSEEEVKLPL